MQYYEKYLFKGKGINYFDTPMQNRHYESLKVVDGKVVVPEHQYDKAQKSLYKFICQNLKQRKKK